MYSCKIYFNNEQEKTELKELTNTSLIRSILIADDFVLIKTRKLWKLYWFYNRFKKFQIDFSYKKLVKVKLSNDKLPRYITDNYKVDIIYMDWFFREITIYFNDIKEAWKVRQLL